MIYLIFSLVAGLAGLMAVALWITQVIRMLVAGAFLGLCIFFYWLYTLSPVVAVTIGGLLILIVFTLVIRNDPEAE
ncbi:hypothetical protein [Novispirillum itersonii]|uniref:Putative MnhB-related membrane protein n=1 Tax=Novispirillum itersonii TaxID=189 RepID=A0A7W9ZHJ8_NOVIT|nr:hypothetical protein [Novispirillum itersonii]MBB6210219.1 putative MnhB-related membrane protein [Novispirillum itersonii]